MFLKKFKMIDLNIQEVQVDRNRENYSISATRLRNQLEENKEFLTQNVYNEIKNLSKCN